MLVCTLHPVPRISYPVTRIPHPALLLKPFPLNQHILISKLSNDNP